MLRPASPEVLGLWCCQSLVCLAWLLIVCFDMLSSWVSRFCFCLSKHLVKSFLKMLYIKNIICCFDKPTNQTPHLLNLVKQKTKKSWNLLFIQSWSCFRSIFSFTVSHPACVCVCVSAIVFTWQGSQVVGKITLRQHFVNQIDHHLNAGEQKQAVKFNLYSKMNVFQTE